MFFAAGAAFPDGVNSIAGSQRRHAVAKLALAYVATTIGLSWLQIGRGPTTVLLSLAAVPLGIRVAVALSDRPVPARVASFIGRRTLPIYVLHMPALATFHQLAGSPSIATARPAQWAILILYPLAATVVVATACLLTYRLAVRAGGSWLFRRPTPDRSRARPA